MAVEETGLGACTMHQRREDGRGKDGEAEESWAGWQ
jgi:hypothetical protein